MLIKLTLVPQKTPFYMRAADIRTIEKSSENPLLTVVSNSIMTNKGPMAYAVLETPEEIAAAIEEALRENDFERRLRAVETALEVFRIHQSANA